MPADIVSLMPTGYKSGARPVPFRNLECLNFSKAFLPRRYRLPGIVFHQYECYHPNRQQSLEVELCRTEMATVFYGLSRD